MGDKEIDKETKGEVRPKDEKDEDILVVEIHDSADISRRESKRPTKSANSLGSKMVGSPKII